MELDLMLPNGTISSSFACAAVAAAPMDPWLAGSVMIHVYVDADVESGMVVVSMMDRLGYLIERKR